ncbi:MAG: decarboxylating 6-phosphogluconate dehydrogenase [Candidatus Spechtbacteria bacterium]|nr:decarboxylating 6-phosphogluconate dehydrogenase [Candidatus Spechtbacteria bacterium]
MKLGIIGLGKMGYNMAERLLERKHDVVAFDVNKEAQDRAAEAGARIVDSASLLVEALSPPRILWLMVPHDALDAVFKDIILRVSDGDTIIDGGNSPYLESMRRASELETKGIHFLDVGVSGGPDGARHGACLMIGGDRKDYERLERLFADLAGEHGYLYVGIHGAGHFLKMAHNAIEYGMMQAIAEGFTTLKESEFEFNLSEIADLYNHGSVVESRLIGWLAEAFEEFGENLENVSGKVGRTGEADWALQAAKELGVSVPVLEKAVQFRIDSEKNPTYTGKLLSAMRNRFGGHQVKA